MKKAIVTIFAYMLVCVALAALGVGAGWQMAMEKGNSGGGHGDDDHGAAVEEDTHAETGLSAQALENLGVRSEKVTQSNYQRFAPVPAVIQETPQSKQPVFTPVGGRVLAVSAELGELLAPGRLVVRVLRDPFPRPTLELSLAAITPATEDYHATKADLRKAMKSAEILAQELERLSGFTTDGGLPLVPRKTLIDLRYEQAQVLQDIANHRQELRLHGISEADLAKLEDGEDVALNPGVWRTLLARNGLWPASASALLAALPAEQQREPWTVAVVSELALQQLASPPLVEWLKQTPAAGAEFASIAGLLQGGATVPQIRDLYGLGAFAAEVSVVVPNGAEDWDVHDVTVRPGDQVNAGDTLLTLADPRRLRLIAMPTGQETAALLATLQNGSRASAEPLVHGSAPDLSDLMVLSVTADEQERPVAYVTVENRELRRVEREGRVYRSWALRPGLRYMLQAPTELLENVIVIPNGGVVEEGADKIVFIRNGTTFLPAKVVVAYSNHQVTVLKPGSEVFPGDDVVVSGAFALKLAVNAGKGEADPHAGHNH